MSLKAYLTIAMEKKETILMSLGTHFICLIIMLTIDHRTRSPKGKSAKKGEAKGRKLNSDEDVVLMADRITRHVMFLV
jgi:hypothetical protein